jgi:hypothetical protein
LFKQICAVFKRFQDFFDITQENQKKYKFVIIAEINLDLIEKQNLNIIKFTPSTVIAVPLEKASEPPCSATF